MRIPINISKRAGQRPLAIPFVTRTLDAVVSGFGGFLTIHLLAYLSVALDTLLLIAPFGASCVLVFAVPQSPLAWPRNVIGGHLLSASVGIAMFVLFGTSPLAYALGVGLAIAGMQLTGTLHPPAGADPIVAVAIGAGWSFLLLPVIFGTMVIVLAAILYHKGLSKQQYPLLKADSRS